MGMFNYVDFEYECPKCGNKLKGFQTKDGNLILRTVSPISVNNFYDLCSKCNAWIDINREHHNKYNVYIREKGSYTGKAKLVETITVSNDNDVVTKEAEDLPIEIEYTKNGIKLHIFSLTVKIYSQEGALAYTNGFRLKYKLIGEFNEKTKSMNL